MRATNKAILALSLARRAGKLMIGYDACERAAVSGRAKLIVTADDISDRTLRNIKRVSGSIRLIEAPFSQTDIQHVMGRRFVVAALTDRNFGELFVESLGQKE